jgi:hypothetical protein
MLWRTINHEKATAHWRLVFNPRIPVQYTVRASAPARLALG